MTSLSTKKLTIRNAESTIPIPITDPLIVSFAFLISSSFPLAIIQRVPAMIINIVAIIPTKPRITFITKAILLYKPASGLSLVVKPTLSPKISNLSITMIENIILIKLVQ